MSKASDIKQTWKLINNLLNKNISSPRPSIFNINGITTNDKTTIVNSFNQYFAEVGPSLAAKIPQMSFVHQTNYPNVTQNSMVLLPTDSSEVNSVILNLKNKSSCGLDQIPAILPYNGKRV